MTAYQLSEPPEQPRCPGKPHADAPLIWKCRSRAGRQGNASGQYVHRNQVWKMQRVETNGSGELVFASDRALSAT